VELLLKSLADLGVRVCVCACVRACVREKMYMI